MSDSRKVKKTYIDKKPKIWKNWKDRDREDISSDWDWKKELEKAEIAEVSAESDKDEESSVV